MLVITVYTCIRNGQRKIRDDSSERQREREMY